MNGIVPPSPRAWAAGRRRPSTPPRSPRRARLRRRGVPAGAAPRRTVTPGAVGGVGHRCSSASAARPGRPSAAPAPRVTYVRGRRTLRPPTAARSSMPTTSRPAARSAMSCCSVVGRSAVPRRTGRWCGSRQLGRWPRSGAAVVGRCHLQGPTSRRALVLDAAETDRRMQLRGTMPPATDARPSSGPRRRRCSSTRPRSEVVIHSGPSRRNHESRAMTRTARRAGRRGLARRRSGCL